MKDILKSSCLCKGMSEEQIDRLIAAGKPKYMKYNKNHNFYCPESVVDTVWSNSAEPYLCSKIQPYIKLLVL